MSRFITIIRPEFMEFCKDACRSAVFNHLLFRIAGKSKDQPKEKIKNGEILWYAKTEQITEEMANAWGTCKVRKEVNALINMGIIGRQSNPAWGADRTKHFCFGQKECKKFLALCEKHKLCIVHLGLPPEVVHLIYLSNANDTSIKCICPIHQMQPIHLSDAFDISIRAIPIDRPTIEEPTKEEDTRVASPHVDAPLAPVDFLPDGIDETDRLLAQSIGHDFSRDHHVTNCHNWRACNGGLQVVSCADYQASINSGLHEALTQPRTEAITLNGATHGNNPAYSANRYPALDRVASTPDQATDVAQGAPNGQLNTLTASASIPGEPENSPLSVQTRHSHISSSLQGTDGAATEGTGRPRASGKQEKPKRTRKKPVEVQLTLDAARLKEWYDELRGLSTSLSKRNVDSWESLTQKKGNDDRDMFLNIVALLDIDPWFEEHKIAVDAYWINRSWENKYIFLRGHKNVPLADKKPMDVYTAASLDPERNKRNLERLKANRLAKEAAQGVSHGTN